MGKYALAKEVLLCRMLGEPYNFPAVAASLDAGMFAPPLNSDPIFGAILSQYAKAGRYDAYTVSSSVSTGMGTLQHLTELSQKHADTDLQTACDWFVRLHGQVVEMSLHNTAMSCLSKGLDAEGIRAEVERERKRLGAVATPDATEGFEEFHGELSGLIEGNIPDHPVKPALKSLRAHVQSWQPGEFVIVGGRTGMGKSYFAINELLANAKRGVPCCYVNLENTPKDVYWRFWQMLSGVEEGDFSRMSSDEHKMFLEHAETLKSLPIKIYNTGRDINRIVSVIRNDAHQRGTKFFVIDYIQLCSDKTIKGRVDMLEEISATCRALPLELKCAFMAVAQINRGAESSADKRPKLSDLKGSGALEQDASTVLLIYRPEYYDITEDENGDAYPPGFTEIEIAKGRKRGPGLIKARFDHIKGFYDTPAPEFIVPQRPPSPPAMNHATMNNNRREPVFEEKIPF